jgi:competence protein ComEA
MNRQIHRFVTLLLLLGLTTGLGLAAGSTRTKGKLADGQVININTADTTQLIKLPRVGEKMAVRILEYRKANGSFKKTQDLMKVKGIGPKVFEKLQHLITV